MPDLECCMYFNILANEQATKLWWSECKIINVQIQVSRRSKKLFSSFSRQGLAKSACCSICIFSLKMTVYAFKVSTVALLALCLIVCKSDIENFPSSNAQLSLNKQLNLGF